MPEGRHRSAQAGQRRLRVAPSLIIAAMVVVLLAGAVTAYTAVVRHSSCSGSTSLTVLTDPTDEPVLNNVASRWDDGSPSVDGRCINLTITGKSDASTAAALSARWDSSRDGPRPDVWAPASSTWVRLAQLRADATAVLPAQHPSIAQSPVVIAMPQQMAKALGWPQQQLSWSDLVTDMGDSTLWAQHGHPEWGAPRLGMSDPSEDTAGLSALLAIEDNDGDGAVTAGELQQSLAFSREVTTSAASTDVLFAGMLAADQRGKPLSYLSAFPATEQAVESYNEQSGLSEKLAAIYPPEGAPAADHPFLTLKASWVGSDTQKAAAALLSYLRSPDAQKSLQSQGYRSYQGTAGSVLSTANGFQADLPTLNRPVENPAVVARAVATYTQLRTSTNTLLVIDTSGSMANPAPGTKTAKLALVKKATTDVLPLFSDSSSLGLWSFSTGSPPYQVRVPDGLLSGRVGGTSRRAATDAALSTLSAGGATSLYDTLLASYKQALASWQPNHRNVVIFITDGKNEVPGGLTQAALLRDLAAAKTPGKPVTFLTIAFGSGADVAALQAVSRVTGGRTLVSTDPSDLEQVYLSALVGG